MELYRQGLSYREISARVGRTRNSVIGVVWRYKKRGGPPPGTIDIPPDVIDMVKLNAFNAYGLSDKSRSVAMYLMCVSLNYGSRKTARAFGCVHSAVSAAAARVENWRDDPVFDAELTALEKKNTPGS